MSKNKILIYIILIILFASVFFIKDLNMEQKLTLATLMIALILWFTKLLSFFRIAVIIITIIIGGGILPISLLLNIFFSDITFLLLGVFILVEAIKRSSIPEIIINKGVLFFGSHILKLLFFSPIYLLVIIPDPISRITIDIPILKSLKNKISISKNNDSLYSLLYIIIPYIGIVSVLVYPLAAPSRILAYHILNDYQEINISFLRWFIISFPLVLLFALILYFLLKTIKRKEWKILEDNLSNLNEFSNKSFNKLDKKLLYLLLVILTLFFTKGNLHNIKLGYIAIIASLLLFLPIIKFFSYKEFIKVSNYPIIFLFTSSLLLSHALKETGLINIFTNFVLDNQFSNIDIIYNVILLSLILFIIRIVFVSNTASLVIFLPFVLKYAEALEINMTWAGMFFLLSFSVTFVLPISWPGFLIFLKEGEYKYSSHIKWGLLVSVIYLFTLFIIAFFYWPLIGLKFY